MVKEFTVIPEALLGEPVVDNGDHVYGYARVLCHFASLVLLFVDAWKEGDGERVLRLWKIMMLHFHSERKTKYALEALRLQFQVALSSADLGPLRQYSRSYVISTTSTSTSCSKI